MYEDITKEKLEEIIKDVYFHEERTTLVMYTGHGGCKDYLKAFHKEIYGDAPYTWRSMRALYRFSIKTGKLNKRGNSYQLES
jgi:hypothetical protein